LSPAAARLFRLIGVFPGPELGVGAAASLSGLPRPEALVLLTELDRANLLTEQSPHRYVMHDLLRAYAAELAREGESGADLRAARGRVLDYCLYTAQVTSRVWQGTWCDLPLPPPDPGAAPETPGDAEAAGAWFDTELTMLVAAVHDAADGFEGHCWRLAWTLTSMLGSRARWAEYAATQLVALAAAERVGDRAGQAYAHQSLGRAYAAEGRIGEATSHLDRALDYFASAGDEQGQGSVRIGLGFAAHSKGDDIEAVRQVRRALDLFRSAGYPPGQALALNNLGWSLTEMGEYDEAVRCCEESVRLRRELGELHPLAGSWDSLGHVHDRLGHHRKAIECYRSSLALYQQTGARYEEAITLSRMADAQASAGDTPGAVESWRRSLAILDAFGDAAAEEIRDRLRVATATH
jgi:tetratricopeptide (TPR) repeat protein